MSVGNKRRLYSFDRKRSIHKERKILMAFGLFDHWANLTNKKEKFDSEATDKVSSYSPYMINRLTSMINLYLPLSAELTKYDLPKDVHYGFWFNILPKRYIKFTYLKKTKDEDNDDTREKVQAFYETGSRDTALIMRHLTKEQKKEIVKKFGGRT